MNFNKYKISININNYVFFNCNIETKHCSSILFIVIVYLISIAKYNLY